MCHACLPIATHSAMMVVDQPSEAVSKPLTHCFLSKVALVTVPLHSKRTVAKIEVDSICENIPAESLQGHTSSDMTAGHTTLLSTESLCEAC